MSLRVTLQYCVSAVQSSTMVGEPSAVRYVTVDICECVKNKRKQTRQAGVRCRGGAGDLRVHVDAHVVHQRLVCTLTCHSTGTINGGGNEMRA